MPADEDIDIEGFEYQARSPPSAIPPSGNAQTYGGANSNDPRLQHRPNGVGRDEGRSNGGGRLKGNPFKRGNHAHNQNSFGIERAPDQSLSSYPTPSAIQGDELAYMGQSSVGVVGQHHPQQQPYPSHAQHPQQYPQPQQQSYEQKQYQQQQQHYHAQGQLPQQQNYPQLPRKSRPGQRAGAAILNGMRNLNISSAMNRIGGVSSKSPVGSPSRMNKRQQNQRRQQHHQQEQLQVNEWETRWDDDSDEEDDDLKPGMFPTQQQPQHPIPGAGTLPTTTITPPIGPPELDSGFSGAAAALVTPAKPLKAGELQQQQQQSSIFPPTHSAAAAVTPGPLGKTPPKPKSTDHAVIDDEINNANDDDGVEWDTGKATSLNVEQFMPLLRVLGKGSFGKVRMHFELPLAAILIFVCGALRCDRFHKIICLQFVQ